MLDEKTLEWLERRKNLCTHCCKRRDCRAGERHNFYTRTCPYWGPLAPGRIGGFVFEDYHDAAEFEARVAIELVDLNGVTATDIDLMKFARLSVEHGMIQEGKGPGRREK